MRNFLELLESAQLSYSKATIPEKREVLRQVTSNRLVSGKNVAVELYPPFDAIANRAKLAKCDLHRGTPRTRCSSSIVPVMDAILRKLDPEHHLGREVVL